MSKRLDELREIVGREIKEVSLVGAMEDLGSDQAILEVSTRSGYTPNDLASLSLLGIDLRWAQHLDNLRKSNYSCSPVISTPDFGVIYHELQRHGVVNLFNQRIRKGDLICDYAIRRGTMYDATRVLGLRIPDSPLRRMFRGSRYMPIRG